jgi:hypothetical protein
MKKRNLIVLVSAALFGGCIPSLNPFYTDKDVVFDVRLLGEWQEEGKSEDPEVWKFEKSGEKAYKLTVVEKPGKEGTFDARLFKLKEERFLDLVPTDCDYATNQADLVAFSMFPGHLLVRVSQLEPELKLAFFDFDWLQKQLDANPKALAHHVEGRTGGEGGRIILTAPTRDLQKFVLKHLGEGELFDKPGEMSRLSGGTTGEAPAAN